MPKEEEADVLGLPPIDPVALLSEAAIEAFARDGAVVVRGALTLEWVDALRKAAEDNMENPGPLCDEHAAAQGTAGRFHDDQFLWRRHDVMRRYVLESGVGKIAARAMRSKTARIFYDQLLVKEPGTMASTPWHNDTSYWQLAGTQICSVWLALDDVPASSGVSYVKGSHLNEIRHAVTNFSGADHSDRNTYAAAANKESREKDEVFDAIPDVDALVAAGQVELLAWDMRPGDVIVFDSRALHGAPGTKNSANRRRGYATRWCGDDVTYDARLGTMATGWTKAGYDAGLDHGDDIGKSPLHPDVVTGLSLSKDT